MINLHNQYRQQNGLPPYQVSQKLNVVAANLAEDEAAHGYSQHVDSQGRNIDQRFPMCGVTNFTAQAENAAYNFSTQATFDAWVNSPGHKANILGNYAAMGIARAAWNGGYIWIADFASPNPGGTATTDNSTGSVTASPSPSTQVSQSPSVTISPSTNQGGTNLALELTLVGIGPDISKGYNNNPTPSSRNVDIEVYDSSDNQLGNSAGMLIYDPATSSFKGNIPLSLQDGIYKVKARFSNTLWKAINGLSIRSEQTTTAPLTKLVSGDIDGNNILNLQDYNDMLGCIQGIGCGDGSQADLNMDGAANDRDLNILYDAFKTREGD
jgi:hypothetical protein